MTQRHVLIVDSEENAKSHLIQLLRKQNMRVISVASADAATSYVKKYPIDFIFAHGPSITRLDAYGLPLIYLNHGKPAPQLTHCIGEISAPYSQDLLESLLTLSTQKQSGKQLIAESPLMKTLLDKAGKIARSESSVFIFGESGTGKEVIANYIHYASKRKAAPFIRVNCAALPETLLESEFFGHEKGAFTGAHAQRIGRFELADTGTLLLDEVTEIPLSLQAKLLRAVQELEFERIGSAKSIRVAIRFIATSNRDIEKAMKEGIFREDLYYRLGVIPLTVPPLRKRKEDIIPLAQHFLAETEKKNELPQKTLSEDAKQQLCSYHWPGNVRELANVIEHGCILSEGKEIRAAQLPIRAADTAEYPFGNYSLKELEKMHIMHTLKRCNYNKTKAARHLNISIRTLRNKLNRWR